MVTPAPRLAALRESIGTLRRKVESHALYSEIETVADLREFMQAHAFAVWDFMSLLKALQRSLTCVSVPWVPSPSSNACRLINEIVLGEESDTYRGGSISHFELYLTAMREAGADVEPITRLTAQIRRGRSLADALALSGAPPAAQDFVQSTFDKIQPGKPHVTAAAFTFGREDLIPSMFREFVRDLRKKFDGLAAFEYYLDRHIDVDGENHGPAALRMIEDLCGDDGEKWAEATVAAGDALRARLQLWDFVTARIVSARVPSAVLI